ncbi:MAG: hypothetical protein FJ218_01360 [Ignavibacteria bacterium]|nr:hypothetical protein [Ignavibacteria bacterium]
MFSCEEPPANSGEQALIFPDSNVSYKKHVQPLFNKYCNNAGCHDQQYSDRHFNLISWGGFMIAQRRIVYAGFPDNSPLILRSEGTLFGPQMPLNRPSLKKNYLNGLRKWVQEGAKDN